MLGVFWDNFKYPRVHGVYVMKQNTDADDAPTQKNDLYAFIGDELRNDNGMSMGTLTRVRAGYDFCHFETASGKVVKRDNDDIFAMLENGYSFN